MTARERVRHLLLHRTTEEGADELLAELRAEWAEEFAAAVLADTPLRPYGSATYYAERHAALIRRLADAAAPTSKEQRDGA